MKRRTSTSPVKVYVFGAPRPKKIDLDLICDQLKKAHRYYNVLIEIERRRKMDFWKLRSLQSPGLNEKEQRLVEVKEAIDETIGKQKASKGHGSTLDPEVLAQELKALKDEEKTVKAFVMPERKRLHGLLAPGNAAYARRTAEWCRAHGHEPQSVKRDDDGNIIKETFPPIPKGKANEAVAEEMLSEPEWSEWWKGVMRIALRATRRRQQERDKCAVSPGTYLLTEAAVAAAVKDTKAGLPKFKKWDGSGQIGVQLKKKLTTKQLFECKNKRLKLEVLPVRPTEKHPDMGRSKRASHRRFAILHMQIGLKRKSDWAKWPCLLHREIPEGLITGARVQVTRVGLRTRYDLQLTIESDAFPRRPHAGDAEGVVAVDLGWRTLPQEVVEHVASEDGEKKKRPPADPPVRVGYLVAEDGRKDEYIIPGTLMSSLRYPDELHSVGHKYFNKSRDAVSEWLHAHQPPACVAALAKKAQERNEARAKKMAEDDTNTDPIPETKVSVAQQIAWIGQWKSHGKLAMLVRDWLLEVADLGRVNAHWLAWRDERLSAKLDLFCSREELTDWLAKRGEHDPARQFVMWLEWWRRKDKHLTQWECDQRRSSRARRRDLYRNWAARLSDTYRTVILEQWDMRDTAKKPKGADPDTRGNPTVRQLVAPSELREAIVQAMGGKESPRVSWDPCENTTRACSQCGHVDHELDARKAVRVVCVKCQQQEDQDERACNNLLAWHGEQRSPTTAHRPSRNVVDSDTCDDAFPAM